MLSIISQTLPLILNDYNGDLVNLFRIIQDNEKLAYLIGRLYLSINAELVFKQNKERLRNIHICG